MKDHELAFAQYKILESLNEPCKREMEYHAIKAIQGYARAGRSIPEELLTYLDQLCDDATKGNYDTEVHWKGLISDVHELRKNGMCRDMALESVAENNNVKLATLTRRYKDSSARGVKGATELNHDMKKWGVQK